MKKSILFYSCFILIALVGIYYGNLLATTTTNLRIWNFQNLLWLLVGFPFILLQKQAGLPLAYHNEAPASSRILKPILVGILFGIADLIIIEFILNEQPHTSLPPYTQPFPYSIFLYSSGAFEIEIFYRLIPITLVLLIFSKIKSGAYMNIAFVVIAILTSLREPIEQFPSGATWFIIYACLSGFGMNLIQALFFKRYGFSSSLMVRLGHYMIWHILNGIYIQYVVLQN